MKRFRTKGLVVSCLIAAFAGGASGQAAKRKIVKPVVKPFECTKRIETSDWKLLVEGVRATKPEMAKKLETDAGFQKTQAENLRSLLALACEAVKEGVLKDPVNSAELENARFEVIAAEFDKLLKKQGNQPAFSSIGPSRVTRFYGVPGNNAKFEEFLRVKLELLKRDGKGEVANAVTKAEIEDARNVFAKVRISEADSRLKARALDSAFWQRTGLSVKLQQAQFLSKIAASAIANKTMASDNEVAQYIAGHPEFDASKKKAKAATILARAKAGEDFAALANEFTDDPGNLGTDGTKAGGIYRDVPKGMMIAIFEKSALALNPGEVAPELVETEFGYHVIKLEKKGEVKQENGPSVFKYDVRHILISTGYKDPENPAAREAPVKDFVKSKLEAEKERLLMDKLVKENMIEIAAFPVVGQTVVKQPVKTRRTRRVH